MSLAGYLKFLSKYLSLSIRENAQYLPHFMYNFLTRATSANVRLPASAVIIFIP